MVYLLNSFFLLTVKNPFAEILLLKTAKHSGKSPLNFYNNGSEEADARV